MADESEEPSSPVRDGLTQPTNPLPRERTEQTASGGGTDDGGTDDGSDAGAASGTADADLPTTDSAGGIAYRPDHEEPSFGDLDYDDGGYSGEPERPGEAPGLNVAAGPAEEADRESADGRELTTDISPSD
jgi:hypothetical protein